jgi:taurine dioxygenase
MSEQLTWTPMEPFGALVDVDLAAGLSDADGTQFTRLFEEHHLLVLRGQALTEQQHVAVMALLGPVPTDGASVVANDAAYGLQGDIRLAFHSDLAFAAEPDLGGSLYAMDLVDDVSSTSFASGVRAYQQLPSALKSRIGGLEAISCWPLDQTRRNRCDQLTDADPRFAHPLVWPHPRTGMPVLYLTEMQTDAIVGLDEAESEALIAELFGYLFDPSNVVVHTWRVGDLAIWDNRALQHAREDVSQVGLRVLRRVSLARRSFFGQFPQFAPTAGGYSDARHEQASG